MFVFAMRSLQNLLSYGFGTKLCHSLTKTNILPVIRITQSVLQTRFFGRSTSLSSKSMKVAVLGAASKTGSCLSLFLKQSSLIDELAIYDTKSTYGLALELNYIDTKCKVSTCSACEACLKQTLEDAKIVTIVADRNVNGKLDTNEILKANAAILSDFLPSIIRFCPRAMVAVAMNPINSLIPLAMEMYKKAGIYDYNRLFGVISIDSIRANTFAAEAIGIEPECVMIPVIGGSCPETCIPIFSQARPCNKISQEEAIRLTRAVRQTDEELLKINKGKEASSFAAAFATARFCISLCKALRHQIGVVEYAYVRSCVIQQVTYFASPLELGPEGIQRHLGVPSLNDYECKLLKAAIPALVKAITLGETLALGHDSSTELCPKYIDSCGEVSTTSNTSLR